MIKIGQIGIGHNHGAAKMESFRKFPDLFEVVGFAEDNETWLERRGGLDSYQGLTRYSVDELIEKCDALIIDTDVWNLTHAAQKCIDCGKHIHLDKPASGTLAEYKKLLDDAKAKNLVVQLGYMYRYNPGIQKCLEMAREGKLGEIFSINAEMSTSHPASYRKWLTNFGGGIMYILGSHLIDLIVYIMGKPEKVHYFGKASMLDDVECEDICLAALEYKNALARVYVSSVEINGFGRRQFVVSGSKATLNICPIERPLTVTYSDWDIVDKTYEDRKIFLPFVDNSGEGRYDEMTKDFYSYIMGEKENPFTYEHEYAVQEVLDQVVGGVRFPRKEPRRQW